MKHADYCATKTDHPGYCKDEIGSGRTPEQIDRMGRKAWIDEVKKSLRALEKAELQMRLQEDLILRRSVPPEFFQRAFTRHDPIFEEGHRVPTEEEIHSVYHVRVQIWNYTASRRRLTKAALEHGFKHEDLE